MAKKRSQKKKRQSGPSGAERQEIRRQRLDARRQAKAKEMERLRRRKQRERLVRMASIAAVLSLLVWFLFLRTGRPGEIGGHEVQLLGETVPRPAHQSGTIGYDSKPPVSGVHAPQPAACGTYSTTIPDEQMVHMLEHGAVGVLFEPDLAPTAIRDIEDLVRSYDGHMFSEPYADMEDPITVVSWGERMPLSSFDGPAIREYVETFGRNAPEDRACDITSDERFQPAPTPTASPTPTGSPSPSPQETDGSSKEGKRE